MNKEQAKKVAKDIFIRYGKEDKVFVASDGQAFLSEGHAKNHAKNNRSQKELEVFSFLRGSVIEKEVAEKKIENPSKQE